MSIIGPLPTSSSSILDPYQSRWIHRLESAQIAGEAQTADAAEVDAGTPQADHGLSGVPAQHLDGASSIAPLRPANVSHVCVLL